MGEGFYFEVVEIVWNYREVMLVQHDEYTKCHCSLKIGQFYVNLNKFFWKCRVLGSSLMDSEIFILENSAPPQKSAPPQNCPQAILMQVVQWPGI